MTGGGLAGWHPDGRNVIIVQRDGTTLERWSVHGDAAAAEPHPWVPAQAVLLKDGRVV